MGASERLEATAGQGIGVLGVLVWKDVGLMHGSGLDGLIP